MTTSSIPASQHDVLASMKEQFNRFSKGQKRIASFMMNQYDKAAYMTASRLGQETGVSESTVVRFAVHMGYKGYPELQRALQEMVHAKLTTIQRMEFASGLLDDDIIRNVLKTDMNNLRGTLEVLDIGTFHTVVQCLVQSKTVYILGMRSASPLALFMGYYFNFLLDSVQVVTSGVNDVLEQMIHISESDTLFAVSFPRYSRRATEVMEYAKQRGAVTIACTDSLLAPIAQFADHTLVAKNAMASFVDSLVAPLSIINALIVAVGIHQKERAAQHFAELERIWEHYRVYVEKSGNDVINMKG